MNKIKRIISVLLAAVLFSALLPGAVLPGFETETAKAALNGPTVKITKSLLNKEGKKAEIAIALDTNPKFNKYTLYNAVATYEPGGMELNAITAKEETTSYYITNYSYSYDLSNHALDNGGKTVLFVWDENGNPRSASALVTDGRTMTDGSIIFEAEDILAANRMSGTHIYTQTDSGENIDVEKELSGAKGVQSQGAVWDISYFKEACIDYEMRKEFYIPDYKPTDVYTLWVRARSEEPETGSIWLKTNSDNTDELIQMSYASNKDGRYRWSKKTISLQSGTNTIDFCTRTKGIVDKFIITRDTTFKPTGIYDTPIYMTPEEQELAWRAIWGTPPVTPPEDTHPRLLITTDKIAELKAKWSKDNGAKLYTSQNYDSIIGGTNSLSSDALLERYTTAFDRSGETLKNKYAQLPLAIIVARCLRYHVISNISDGYVDKTLTHFKTYLNTVDFDPNESDVTRKIGDVILTASIVYDWLYDKISDSDKGELIDKIMELVARKEVGWPPKDMSDVASHAGEQEIFRDLLAAGIAIYDEEPLLYDLTAARMFNAMYEPRNWLRQSGRFEQGNDYGEWRGVNELWAEMLIRRMTGGEKGFLDKEKDYPAYQSALRNIIYMRLPYGSMLAVGDNYSNTIASDDKYYANNLLAYQLGANLFNDPMLKHEYIRREHLSDTELNSWDKCFALIFDEGVSANERDENIELDNVPLSVYSKYPVSGIVARTSWQEGADAPTALAFMDMHEVFVGDHQHKYTGDFQIYYKGLLAMTTGVYNENQRHNEGYNHRAVSANTMLVEMPEEEFISGVGDYKIGNDGGQRQPLTHHYDVLKFSEFGVNSEGKATNEELVVAKDVKNYIGPNEKTPKVSYIKGDLTPAYNSAKLEDYKRSMVFIDRDDDTHPAAFIVYDRIKSTNKDYTKKWLLHSEEEPTISGNKTTVTRTERPENSPTSFGGKLVNTTLLPASVNIAKKGDGTLSGTGSMINYVDGYDTYQDYSITNKVNAKEVGRYRIEISPSAKAQDDTFLNAMYVTDADESTELSMTKLSHDKFDGVLVGGRDTVLFNKGAELINASFTIEKTGNGFAFITGLTPGKWIVNNTTEFEVGEDGEALYFEAPEGTYTIAPSNGSQTSAPAEEPQGIITHTVTPTYKDFMELYPVQTGTPSTAIPGYEISGAKYGYPYDEKPTSKYAGTQNPYVFDIKSKSGYTSLSYYADNNEGKLDSVKATVTKEVNDGASDKNWGLLNSPKQDYIQLVNANSSLLNDGGIIEMKFSLKMHDNRSRLVFLGLPTWRNYTNINHNLLISAGKHTMTSTGAAEAFTNGIDLTEWNDYILRYDIDNKKWHFIVNEGTATEYRASANLAATKPESSSSLGQYASGSKGLYLCAYPYPDGDALGEGFIIKDFHVSRLRAVPSVTGALADNALIPDSKLIKTSTGKISFTLDDASKLSNADVSLKTGTQTLTGTISSDTVTFDTAGKLSVLDTVKFYIKGNLMAHYLASDALPTSFGELSKKELGDYFVWLQTKAGYGYFLNLEYPTDRFNPDGTGDKTYFPVELIEYLGCTVTKDMANKSATISKGSQTPVTLTGLVEHNGTLYTEPDKFNEQLKTLTGYNIENQGDRKITKFLKN